MTESAFLSNSPAFPKTLFLEGLHVSHMCPSRWKLVWSVGGMKLKGERRKAKSVFGCRRSDSCASFVYQPVKFKEPVNESVP
jgi:hypothetical protein